MIAVLFTVILMAQAPKDGWPALLDMPRDIPAGDFHVLFFSIIIEALPFVILGVIGSMALEVFVAPETVQRLLPRAWLPGILMAGLLGFLFPFCECGLVPIVRRLMEKGVPAPLAAVFLLTAPVVNPVVGAATYFAFFSQPEFVVWRLGGAYGVAVLTGVLLISRWQGRSALKGGAVPQTCGCGHSHCGTTQPTLGQRLGHALDHGQDEFFSITRYLVIGAFLAASVQVFLPREMLTAAGQHAVGSVGVMMAFAFLLSLCSGADAFVANTFVGSFTPGALTAFMVLGPMVDLKNLLMMAAAFQWRFILRLVFWVVWLTLLLGVLINRLGVLS